MRRLAALSIAVAGCGAPQAHAEPPADPSSAAGQPVPDASAGTDSAPASAPSPPRDPSTSAPPEKEPPPLRAGTGTPTPPGTAKRKEACSPDTVRQKLQQVVGECKKSGARICGELKVRASEDGKSIKVSLEVTKDSFDDAFSRCVTSHMNSVAWQCTLPGSDVSLDLGCNL